LPTLSHFAAFASAGAGDLAARELVLRLASLLWRLRRATAIETDLFEIQAEVLRERCVNVPSGQRQGPHGTIFRAFEGDVQTATFKHPENGSWPDCDERIAEEHQPNLDHAASDHAVASRRLTYCFLRLANLESGVFGRLNRYEAALWRASPCKLGIATFARETAACS
jgi:hypothetical protein